MKWSLMLLLFSNLAFANTITISNSTIRLVPPVSKTTAMFLEIKNNTDKDIKLLKVNGDLSNNIELHEMKMDNNSMQMRALNEILIPKKSFVKLQSGGLHIMIFNAKKVIRENDKHKFKFYFDNDSVIENEAIVKNLNWP